MRGEAAWGGAGTGPVLRLPSQPPPSLACEHRRHNAAWCVVWCGVTRRSGRKGAREDAVVGHKAPRTNGGYSQQGVWSQAPRTWGSGWRRRGWFSRSGRTCARKRAHASLQVVSHARGSGCTSAFHGMKQGPLLGLALGLAPLLCLLLLAQLVHPLFVLLHVERRLLRHTAATERNEVVLATTRRRANTMASAKERRPPRYKQEAQRSRANHHPTRKAVRAKGCRGAY